MAPRVLVVQNTPDGGPGRFGDRLVAAGVELDVVAAHTGAALPDRLTHDGLIVLGGGYLPDADARAPWLPATRALAAEAVERAFPYFGICLGGQLLAHVTGGAVRGDWGDPEIGSTTVTFRTEASDDPLFGGLPGTVTAIERHFDAITALPPGARWLATSERCPYQAFRYGDRAWGVQFHPEVEAARLRTWDADMIRRHGFDPEEVRRRAARDEPAALPVWRTVADRFAALVHGGEGVATGRPSRHLRDEPGPGGPYAGDLVPQPDP
jgi:GMP synthase (glutamine-hydrolysing)